LGGKVAVVSNLQGVLQGIDLSLREWSSENHKTSRKRWADFSEKSIPVMAHLSWARIKPMMGSGATVTQSFTLVKGVVHFKKKKLLLIIYLPPCHPRCPCLSIFSRKEIKFFDENIPGFSQYNGLQWEPNGSRSK